MQSESSAHGLRWQVPSRHSAFVGQTVESLHVMSSQRWFAQCVRGFVHWLSSVHPGTQPAAEQFPTSQSAFDAQLRHSPPIPPAATQ